MSQETHQEVFNSSFCRMKWLYIWDASPPQSYPQHYDRRYPFIHLAEERQVNVK